MSNPTLQQISRKAAESILKRYTISMVGYPSDLIGIEEFGTAIYPYVREGFRSACKAMAVEIGAEDSAIQKVNTERAPT